MPLFEIRNAHLLRAPPFLYHPGKVSWISFASGNNDHISTTAPCPWKSFRKLNKEDDFNVLRLPFSKGGRGRGRGRAGGGGGGGRFLIKAISSTIEPKSCLPLPAKSDKCSNAFELTTLNPQPPGPRGGGVLLQFSEEELHDREKLRRLRISKANKGNTPWNKGRKHSPETLLKIRERTRIAMQNPKVKMKLTNLGHAQTTETKLKIGAKVRKLWERRRGRKMVQESCCYEWQNLIAEASMLGYVGQEELQWNSYTTLDEQLKQEWLASVEQRKQMVRAPVSNRAPKSPEQRRKIAEAIVAKWTNPEYRERVCSAMAKYHHSTERKPRTRPSSVAQLTKKKKPITKRDSDTSILVKPIRLRKSKSPAFKDPLVNSKLEMIKNIRAQRASAETRQTQAIQQARLLIAEAEKAAKALEVAATNSPTAQSSLIETRKLIAEAIQSLESIDTIQGIAERDVDPPKVDTSKVNKEKEPPAFEVLNQSQIGQVNGHSTLLSSSDYNNNNYYYYSESDFGEFSLEKAVNGDPEPLHLTNGCASLPFSLKEYSQSSSSSKPQRETEQDQKTDLSQDVSGIQSLEDETISTSPIVTKKWVRGRLVEVTEEKK